MPEIDPITGAENTAESKPQVQSITINQQEWNDIKSRLDSFEQRAGQFAPQQQIQPTGPTYNDQIQIIDKQLDAIDAKIDEASNDGKPISSLLKERDRLSRQATRLQIQHEDLNPALNAGIGAIEQLSSEVTRGKMKYYDIVKVDFERALRELPADQRMNPTIRQTVYELAVGRNAEKILSAKQEEVLRSVASESGASPGGKNGRNSAKNHDSNIPRPKDILPREALMALKSRNISVDDHYRKLGYTGWEDFYNKSGKEYFESQGADLDDFGA